MIVAVPDPSSLLSNPDLEEFFASTSVHVHLLILEPVFAEIERLRQGTGIGWAGREVLRQIESLQLDEDQDWISIKILDPEEKETTSADDALFTYVTKVAPRTFAESVVVLISKDRPLRIRVRDKIREENLTGIEVVEPSDWEQEITYRYRGTPSAEIEKIWPDWNAVFKDGRSGTRIHVNFSLEDFRNRKGRLSAYFYWEDGKPLLDVNGKFCTKDGGVACGRDFRSSHVSGAFPDLPLYLPDDELHITEPGEHRLKFRISAWNNEDDEELCESDFVHFNYQVS